MAKLQINRGILALVLGVTVASGCKKEENTESNVTAMESSDWFKDGVDRFYLATIDTGFPLEPGSPENVGEEFLFGIGCYGESKDRNAILTVPANAKRDSTVKKPLSARYKLHEFPIINPGSGSKSAREVRGGKCEILLGSKEEPQRILNNPANYVRGDQGQLIRNFFYLGSSCVGLTTASVTLLGMIAGAGAATAATGGAAAPVAIPPIVAGWIGVVTSLGYCTFNLDNGLKSFADFQKQENKSLFFKVMGEAEEKTDKKLSTAADKRAKFKRFVQNVQSGRHRIAASIWNPEFAATFNKDVYAQFENGWGKESKFFDAVRSVQTDLATGVKDFHNSSTPAKEVKRCDVPKFESCKKQNITVAACEKKHCVKL